ncbi:hypothetical protein D3C72_1278450 [compost metagenome]
MRGRHHGFDELGVVRHHQRDGVATSDAQALQGPGQRQAVLVQLQEAAVLLGQGRARLEREGDRMGTRACVMADEIGQGLEIRHVSPP